MSLGLIGVPAAALAADEGGTQAQPTVTQTGGSFTVTLPGVGSLSFSVDPTTHNLTGLIVTPADASITAGTPVLTDEGVQVLFTSPTGAQTLEVEVEGGAVPVVKAEAQGADAAAESTVGDEGNDNGASDNENQAGDNNGDQGENEGMPPTTPTTTPTTTGTDDRSGDGSGDGSDSATTPSTPTSTTTTTTTSGEDGGSSSGSGDGGSSDGGSSSSGGGSGSDG